MYYDKVNRSKVWVQWFPWCWFPCKFEPHLFYSTLNHWTSRNNTHLKHFWSPFTFTIAGGQVQYKIPMMTSPNGTIFRVTGYFCGELPEFPIQRPVTRSLMFSLICSWINDWANNRKAGDLGRHHAHYDVVVMSRDRNKIPTNTSSNVEFHIKTENPFKSQDGKVIASIIKCKMTLLIRYQTSAVKSLKFGNG